MTRIAVCSDLHLEFGTIFLKNVGNADILVLSGDICVACDLEFLDLPNTSQHHLALRYIDFFKQVSEEFSHVIYVMGNHEHYRGDFKYTYNILKRALTNFTNIHVLEKETFVLGDTTFVGGTLWTDMNKSDPLTLQRVKNAMNDFQCVENSNMMVSRKVPLYEDKELATDLNAVRKITGYKFKEDPSKFSPMDSVDDHKKMLAYIRHVIEGPSNQKFVVVGHHTPSFMSCSPAYANDTSMNGAFHSDLSEFILDHQQIKLWTCGHTHDKHWYYLDNTLVACNPRGYIGHERCADEFQLMYIDLDNMPSKTDVANDRFREMR